MLSTQTVAFGRFESARQLATPRGAHPPGALHGHGFVAGIHARLPSGWAAFAGDETGALRARLCDCLAPLDYRHLNQIIDEPTDAALARWIAQRLGVPGLNRVSVQSTPAQGTELDAAGAVQVWRRYRFLSAHWLPHVPAGHKCGRLHGHGFQAVVRLRGDAAADGYDRLDAGWAPVWGELDHRCLNEIAGLANPTSELLSSWLWRRLAPALPDLASVSVYETASCGATFDGARYQTWKDFTLDSAVRLAHAPAGDPRAAVHGQTYTARLVLEAPLDAVMGWTLDFGDVKTLFDPIFLALDHRPLHECLDLEQADGASLAHWIFAATRERVPALARVELYEADGCGSIVGAAPAGFCLPCAA